MADSIALLVAIDEYDDPGLRQLQAPQHDLAALARVLGNPLIGGYQVRTLHNQPMHVIQEQIGDLFAERVPDDRLLLYFSGHGLKSDSGDLYLAATGTKLRTLTATAVPSWFVKGEVGRSRSRGIILLLDCCYGGAFSRGDLVWRAGEQVDVLDQFQDRGRGQAVITASTAMQFAFELDQDRRTGQPSPSVFTGALVRGLETGEADRDHDGWISVDELYDYLYDEVRRQVPGQTPTRSINVEGGLYIARSRRRQAAPRGPLPAAVHEAIGSPLPSVREGVVGDLKSMLASTNPDVARAAGQALERLVEDDSRRVSSAAATALGRHDTPTPIPTPAPTQHRVAPDRPRLPSELGRGPSHSQANPFQQSVPRQPAPAPRASGWTVQPVSKRSPDRFSAISQDDPSAERDWLRARPRRRSKTADMFPILVIAGLLVGLGAAIWLIIVFKPLQGTGWSLVSLPLIGLLAGGVAKAILPGDDPGGIIVTMVIGLVGSLLGALVGRTAFGIEPFTGFFGLGTWVTAVAGSTFLLLLYRIAVGRGRGRRRVI
jgi:uncharacterized membrane protein YeaQ/YmgE (transglycosylase-associated protein family)